MIDHCRFERVAESNEIDSLAQMPKAKSLRDQDRRVAWLEQITSATGEALRAM